MPSALQTRRAVWRGGQVLCEEIRGQQGRNRFVIIVCKVHRRVSLRSCKVTLIVLVPGIFHVASAANHATHRGQDLDPRRRAPGQQLQRRRVPASAGVQEGLERFSDLKRGQQGFFSPSGGFRQRLAALRINTGIEHSITLKAFPCAYYM